MCSQNLFSSLALILLVAKITYSSEYEDQHTTLPIKERIDFLKFQLKEQLKSMKVKHNVLKNRYADDEEPQLVNINYDYVDLSRQPITPINENDERKVGDRFKLRQLKTTTTTTTTQKMKWPSLEKFEEPNVGFAQPTTPNVPGFGPYAAFNPLSDLNVQKMKDSIATTTTTAKPKASKGGKSKKKHHKRGAGRSKNKNLEPILDESDKSKAGSQKPVNIFYKQRRLLNPSIRDTPVQWTHCQDLISPYLKGVKTDLNAPKIIGPTHRSVLRLVHLLNQNTSQYTKQDVYSLMYQISNMQIRLFQWDTTAIKVLFNAIVKGKRHTFKNLKYGMKRLFAEWHLDFSNTTNLLTQSRLFRPACINLKENDGSTKSSRTLVHTSKFKPVKKLEDCDDSSSSA